MDAMNEILGFPWALGSSTTAATTEEAAPAAKATTTEELAEEILWPALRLALESSKILTYLGIHSTHSTLLRETRFTSSIIHLTLFGI